MDRVVGILLAAGRSRRLGQPKQLLPFGGTTLLERVVQGARLAPLDDLVVVLGPDFGPLAVQFNKGGVRSVLTPPSAPACSVSVQTGLASAPGATAIVLMLGDQPGVGPEQIATVLAGWRASGKPVAVGSYQGVRGHPFILSGLALAQVPSIDGEKGVWHLIEAHPEWVHTVAFDSPLPRDVDVWDDYLALLDEFSLPRPDEEGGGPSVH